MKKLLFSFLLSPDPAEGVPVTDSAPNMPAMSPAGDPPPAATVVANGEITEEVVRLRKKSADLEADKKRVETEASVLRDENERLKKAGLAPAPIVDKRSTLEKFMDGEDV